MAGFWSRIRRWKRKSIAIDALRIQLQRFRHLIEMNNRVLELMHEAEAMLSGEFLFDVQYLRTLQDELSDALTAVVYDLGEISGNRYPDLGHALERVLANVRASLGPGHGAETGLLTMPLSEAGSETAAATGEKMARLGEIGRLLDLPVPPGFVATVRACTLLLDSEPIAARKRELEDTDATGMDGSLEELVTRLDPPSEVRRAIERALTAFDRSTRFAVRSSAVGEDGDVSFAGQYRTELNVKHEEVLGAWRRVVASFFAPSAVEYRRRAGHPLAEAKMAVGCIAMVPAVASGVAYSVDPVSPKSGAMIVTAAPGLGTTVVEGRGAADRFSVSRSAPHAVLSRAIADKDEMGEPAPEGGVHVVSVPEEARRSPAVSDAFLAELAECVLRIERHMRCPQDVEWAVAPDGSLVVLQARPLELQLRGLERTKPIEAAERHRKLLAGVGDIACRGIGIGRVFVVGPNDCTEGFAAGDVLVARHAAPSLSAAVARAAALVTEVGAVTGHLATVAREYRVPAIVGAARVTRILEPGTLVTIDADDNVVYEGAVEELLSYQLLRQRAYEDSREFRMLRSMLRSISPLSLRDPSAASFTPAGCRTCHDIIRFAHEKALAELTGLDSIKLGRRGPGVRRLDLEIPLDLVLIDLGGAIGQDSSKAGSVAPEQVSSRPLRALLEGLSAPGVWATNPADMDLEGLMASATRAGPLTVPGGVAVQQNTAIASEDYLNLNLRVGYHFNVVDSFIGEKAEDGYVFFRFVGGVTDMTRRARRARLLAAILAHHGFQVEQKADVVVGRLRGSPASVVEDRLRMVGRLIGFSRQLDISLRDDESVDRLAENFLGSGPDATTGPGNILERRAAWRSLLKSWSSMTNPRSVNV